jgi:hypothetical protein
MVGWKPVPGYEGRYEVSAGGNVRSIARQCRTAAGHRLVPAKVLSPAAGASGYLIVSLAADGHKRAVAVHDLVLSAFRGLRPPGAQARHLDGDKTNNSVSNLAWGTAAENADDRVRHGTQPRGEQHGRAILTERQVHEIRAATRGIRRMNERYGVSRALVEAIRARRIWRHV